MRTNVLFALAVAGAMAALVACSKEAPASLKDPKATSFEESGSAKALWPRIRFRYNYEFINGCSGGECGSCIGFCILWPVRLGPAPTETELDMGIGRAQLSVVGDDVVIVPMDLPMDPGTGEVIIDDDFALEEDVAERLGYTEVELHGGTYEVDYGGNDPYGSIKVPAELIP